MTLQIVVFILFSLITLGSGVAVVTNQNLLHSAYFLILSFVGVAGLYVMLEAGFLAVVQILVYVGAIAVLIVFAIMLTRQLGDKGLRQRNAQWGWALAGSAALLGVLGLILYRADWSLNPGSVPENSVQLIGENLLGTYLVPFEVASVVLLIALIGAIIIAREKETS